MQQRSTLLDAHMDRIAYKDILELDTWLVVFAGACKARHMPVVFDREQIGRLATKLVKEAHGRVGDSLDGPRLTPDDVTRLAAIVQEEAP